ncbi:MAG: hypothetical protein JXQ75_16845 [Phycisphaerae bacterium]|nr:hypothetical protein [Phycisphaerae bacterium]
MDDKPADTASVGAPPDWTEAEDAPHCPLCDYNLYGLTNARCPECGYPFEWADLLDARRRRHPYLFEHHPEANARSYWRTAIGGLRPRRFWSSLHPVQPSRPKRLLLYWCIGAVLWLFAIAAQQTAARAAWAYWSSLHWRNAGISVSAAEVYQYISSGFLLRDVAAAGLVALGWGWLTWLTLILFRFSMRRAKVNATHVLRCVLYSFDPAVWASLALAVVALLIISSLVSPALVRQEEEVETILTVLVIAFMTYRLAVAYRRYLRFSHPVTTILASQVIVLLVVVNVISLLTLWR